VIKPFVSQCTFVCGSGKVIFIEIQRLDLTRVVRISNKKKLIKLFKNENFNLVRPTPVLQLVPLENTQLTIFGMRTKFDSFCSTSCKFQQLRLQKLVNISKCVTENFPNIVEKLNFIIHDRKHKMFYRLIRVHMTAKKT
jgi:hypothetical protein